MTAFLSLERKRAHALRRAKHVQIALLLPSVVGSLVLGVLSSGSFNFYDSAENILTVTVPAGATSNLYWPALMYLPILVTIFFLVSGMQAKVLVEASDREQHAREDQVKRMVTGEMNSRNSVSETSENDLLKRTSMSEQLRRVKLANVLRVPNQSAAKELTRPHPEARASLEDEEDVLRKRQERNVTPLEALHAIGLVIFVSVFLIVPSLVHSENPLFATVDVPNLIVQITTLALGIVIAFGIVWNLRLSILRHEPSGAVTRLRRLMRRSKQVIGVQFFLMMHVSVFALSLPPLLSPLAFESGYLLTAPCALVNASYLRHYCEPFLPAVHTRTDSAADAVWLQALGRTRRCVDGGWNEYVSVHNACHAACAATMLRARSYSSLFLSLNVMFNLLFTELTTDVTSQTMDQWVRVSRSGWPTKGAANIFYHLAMASCAIFLAVALMPGQGPFGLPRTLQYTMVANCACWVCTGVVLNIEVLYSRVVRQAEFDVFISYRVNADASTADRLHDKLKAAGLKVWYDRVSLKKGQPWQRGFIDGLTKSAVYMPILTREALRPMTELYPEKEDNVLIEMRLALEIHHHKQQGGVSYGICPVFIGPPLDKVCVVASPDLPRSPQFSPVLPSSPQIFPDLPRSAQICPDLPRSSPFSAELATSPQIYPDLPALPRSYPFSNETLLYLLAPSAYFFHLPTLAPRHTPDDAPHRQLLRQRLPRQVAAIRGAAPKG